MFLKLLSDYPNLKGILPFKDTNNEINKYNHK